MFDQPKPMRIAKIRVNTHVYPHHAEFQVDFITKIGKDPFHKVDLAPINYSEAGPLAANGSCATDPPRYIVSYLLTIKIQ
jgi:hypothetical protein